MEIFNGDPIKSVSEKDISKYKFNEGEDLSCFTEGYKNKKQQQDCIDLNIFNPKDIH